VKKRKRNTPVQRGVLVDNPTKNKATLLREKRREAKNKKTSNPLALDPSRTIALRRQVTIEITKRFSLIKAAVAKLMENTDWSNPTFTNNAANILPLKNVQQTSTYDCGAAVAMSVGRYFGVGPTDLGEWRRRIGTERNLSTSPSQIIDYLEALGLNVVEHHGMNIEDLDRCITQGSPVICPIQETGERDNRSGHYVIVVGVIADDVIVLDPTVEDRLLLPHSEFLDSWHDVGEDGTKYERYGIVVSSSPVTHSLTTNLPSTFSPEKLSRFKEWIKTQVDAAGLSDEQLWKRYVEAGFKKGLARSFGDVKKIPIIPEGSSPHQLDFYEGTRDEFLRSSFAQPESIEKIQELASRSYESLKGVTSDMSDRMSQTLVDGLTEGKGPREIARDLDRAVDIGKNRALVVARTEIIRAHSEGQLTAMENLGITDVGAQVEVQTADDKTCEQCEGLKGVVLPVDKARGKIPIHPNCRCCWLPALPDWVMKQNSNPEGHNQYTGRVSLSPKEVDEVERYTRGAAYTLNGDLRRGQSLGENDNQTHEVLQGVFSMVKEHAPVPLIRALDLSGNRKREFVDLMKTAISDGHDVKMPGYSSCTSKGIDEAHKTYEGNVYLHIKANKGLDVKKHSRNPKEDEVLLNHNSTVKPTRMWEDGKGLHVEMRQTS
jgi:SPP1 gp7 family putative phage head morphogenesis protein